MSVLLLRLAGPLQAWGDSSRFTSRDTRERPTKSGVLGLLAAAQGRRRTDAIEDLAELRFGVRTDQEGRLLRDFHTSEGAPLSNRYYLMDAVFLAGVEGDPVLLQLLADALLRPRFALYLGRRSCPTQGRLSLGIVDDGLEDALRNHPWLAANWYRRQQPTSVPLPIALDAGPDDSGPLDRSADSPLDFSRERRRYAWRSIRRERVVIENPEGHADPDFFLEVKGA